MANKAIIINTVSNLEDIAEALNYCKTHSSPETYQLIKKSMKRTFWITLLSMAILLVIVEICLTSTMGFRKKQKGPYISPNGIEYVTSSYAHVYGDILWWINNDKYEINMSDFGYNSADYEDVSYFKVYFNAEHEVVDISPDLEKNKSNDIPLYVLLGSMIVWSIGLTWFALWGHKSKSKLNPMREWALYFKWYRESHENGERYEPEI